MTPQQMADLHEGITIRFFDGNVGVVTRITDRWVWIKFVDDGILGGFTRDVIARCEIVTKERIMA